MTTNASILAWRIPWTEDTVNGVAESDMTKQQRLSHFFLGIWTGASVGFRNGLDKEHRGP